MPALTPITATFDAGLTTTIAAMFGTGAGASPTIATGGQPVVLAVYTLDFPVGCLADVTDIAAKIGLTLTGINPGDVDPTDGVACTVIDWNGSPTPLDGTPTVISGSDLSALNPGVGMVGQWYTSAGTPIPPTSTPSIEAVWSGTPATQAILLVSVDLDSTAGTGQLEAGAPVVSALFAPGSPCAAVETYRPPVQRYPGRADRPSSVVGDRSAFRRR